MSTGLDPMAAAMRPVSGATTSMATAKGRRKSPDCVTDAPKP
jgi:hypothetical protein